MALSDELQKLTDQSRHLEDSIEATRAKNDSAITERKTELDAELAAARTRIGDNMIVAADDAAADWADARKAVADAFASLRADADARHAKWSAQRAGRAADDAEAAALDSIDFALYAIREAEYSVLDAAAARDEADAKVAAAGGAAG
jgi:hypothetical protein